MSTIIERAEQAAKSGLGYSYNPQVLAKVCDDGFAAIPDGATLTEAGGQTLKLMGGAVVCIKDGVETKRTPITTDAIRDQVVIMYAVSVSKTGIHTGTM